MTKLRIVLLLALAVSLTLGVTACKDDDSSENKPNEETSEAQADQDMADAAQFWDVVGQLTDEPMPDEGWLQATYAPSVGEPDGGNTAVRIVQCEDAESAAERFADLVGLTLGSGFNADTQEYTYRLLPSRQDGAGVGTLTYRRTGGEALATVDVDIPQMPGLQQIIYRQHAENGSFDGTAYYRFGDVVAKNNADGQTDFWICVRPALGFASKGDSHWITVSKLPSENVKTVNKTVKGQRLTHLMPKNLCANQEHMQNLAELLYAMLFPARWDVNLKDNDGYRKLKYFKDINYTKYYDYDNANFFSQVAANWGDEMFQQIFGLSKDEMRQELQQNGLNLIYSTATMSSNNITLPVATFSGTNLKTKTLGKKTSDWSAENFNIYDLTRRGYFGFTNSQGIHVDAWCVRYATGATLAKGSAETPTYDYYKKLPNCTDVKLYNHDVDKLDMQYATMKNTAPIKAGALYLNRAYTLRSFYQPGDVVEDENGIRWFCVQPSTNGHAEMKEKLPCDYSYFVSFDRKAVGEGLENIVKSGNLAIQMLYDMEALFHGALKQHFFEGRQQGMIYYNIKNYAGLDMGEVFGVRDSVVVRGNDNDRELNDFLSTLYRDDDGDGEMCVLRFYVDYTKSNANGVREVEWRASTNYSKDWQRRMTLSDLADQTVIDAYSDAPWVYSSWWEPFQEKEVLTNVGRRTATEAITPLSRFIYKRGEWFPWLNTVPTNMYREPIAVFAAKVVKDEGRFVNQFSDGTAFLPVRLMAEVSDDLFLDDETIASVQLEYGTYSEATKDHAIFLNNNEMKFGMSNLPR